MLKRVAMAMVLVLAGGVFVSPPARAQESSDAKARWEQKREENQAKRKAERAQRKADRELKRGDRKGFLKSLWPFGQEEEKKSFNETNRFGTGNPRDTSFHGKPKKSAEVKRHPRSRIQRDGMNFSRKSAPKKSGLVKSGAVSRSDNKRYNREIHSHQNGEFRRDAKGSTKRSSTLNWRIPQKAKAKPTYSHKDGFQRKP